MIKKIQYSILIGFVLRFLAAVVFGDFDKAYYWEYGEIAKNITHGNGYSLFYMENSERQHHFKGNVTPAKSAYMPPGYVYFLLPFMQISDIAIRNFFIYLFQIIIASISVYLVYLLTIKIFNEKTALIAALIVAILLEFIYAILSFSPTVIYQLLVLSLIILLLNLEERITYQIVSAFLIAIIIYFDQSL